MSAAARIVVALVISSSVAGLAQPQDLRYEGRITTVEQTRVEILSGQGKDAARIWIGVTPTTPVLVTPDRSIPFSAAKLKKDATVIVTVSPEPPTQEWSCAMHTHVAETKPGKCPVCGMALSERDRAVPAKTIEILKTR